VLHYTRQERLAKDKYSSLLGQWNKIKCCENSPWGLYYKTICVGTQNWSSVS